MKMIRWLAFVPLAFIASVVASGAMAWLGEFVGGGSWYVWSISGVVAAYAFFYVAFRIAPERSAIVKWVSVAIVGCLGGIVTLGFLVGGKEPIRALTGILMVAIAVYFGRKPISDIQAEVLPEATASTG